MDINGIINSSKYKEISNFFDQIKTFDSKFNNLSLCIYDKLDGYFQLNASIETTKIFLYQSLFVEKIIGFHIKTEHIIAAIGHELGHYKYDHLKQNYSIIQEYEADQYSISILKRLNINTDYMINLLGLIFLYRKKFDMSIDNILLRIKNLSQLNL